MQAPMNHVYQAPQAIPSPMPMRPNMPIMKAYEQTEWALTDKKIPKELAPVDGTGNAYKQ